MTTVLRSALALVLFSQTTAAQATCTLPVETALPRTQVVLVAPNGQTTTQVTGADGKLTLKRLRRGAWLMRLASQTGAVPVQVGGDRKLVIQTVTVSYSCSAPGGPARHAAHPGLRQLNRKAD
ncbi:MULTISPECIES: hypothetical protein [unclassified Novosphingobium]|uniref:hypothetical protein n=1 Tax=unclassified Novosphingobium TaxID=2644732 RepID=UPI000EDD1B89|nr:MULTISPECIES: hypothetical protein [unclassified Novosphingobium]HCF24756.1 hypothetical protein [Novosphingobium sp.]HQV02033.1 hypothetical protein [Novosphingobium sp.]